MTFIDYHLFQVPIMPLMSDDRTFYDRDGVLDAYLEHREWVDNPNATIERPTFYELAGDLSGLDIIDLGCGYGDFGLEALGAGTRSYSGVEASQRMAERARQTLAGTGAHVELRRLEDWRHVGEPVDLVTARLVLHYIEDLAPVLNSVVAALKTGGRFIFSVEHPVLTSCSKSLTKGRRDSWEVDDYFSEGPRTYPWLGQEVTKYHRTLETQLTLLQEAGLVFEALREGRPQVEHFSDPSEYERRERIPLFLTVKAKKPF